MDSTEGETPTDDQQPQQSEFQLNEYEFQVNEYQYETSSYCEPNSQQEVPDRSQSQATSKNNYYDASSGNVDSGAQFHQQPQYSLAPPQPPQPAANQLPPYRVAYEVPSPPPPPPPPQQPAVNDVPHHHDSVPIHPMYHSGAGGHAQYMNVVKNSHQQAAPAGVGFAPATQQPNKFQPPHHQAAGAYDPKDQFPAPSQWSSSTTNKWTTGLCGCCEDRSICMITCCCPCIVFGQNAEIIDKSSTGCMKAASICYVLSTSGLGSCYACTYRSKLRGQWSIPGDPCCDWLVHCCCSHCAICQEYRELKNRGLDPSAGWAAHAGKVKQGGVMTAPAAQAMPR